MIIGFWLFVVPSVGFAQTPSAPDTSAAEVAQAKELYRLGAGLYKAGRYEEAIGAFEEAYALSGNPKLLYNIANAQERLGELDLAVTSLRAYRPHAPPEDRPAVDLRVAALEERAARQAEVTTTAPAPAAAPPVVAEPEPQEPPAVPSVAPMAPELAVQRRRPSWALVGVGTAVAVGFGTTAAVTYGAGRNQQTEGNQGGYQTSRTLNNVSVPLAGVGGALAVLGLVWPGSRVTVAPEGQGARVSYRF